MPFRLGSSVCAPTGARRGTAFLMQFLADLARLPVEVPRERETTALGAAALAGLGRASGTSTAELASALAAGGPLRARAAGEEAERLLAEWRMAVKRALLLEAERPRGGRHQAEREVRPAAS